MQCNEAETGFNYELMMTAYLLFLVKFDTKATHKRDDNLSVLFVYKNDHLIQLLF